MRDRFTFLTGVILIGIGVLWLLGLVADFEVPWEYVLPVALIGLGVVFIIGRGGDGSGGAGKPPSQFERDDAPRVP